MPSAVNARVAHAYPLKRAFQISSALSCRCVTVCCQASDCRELESVYCLWLTRETARPECCCFAVESSDLDLGEEICARAEQLEARVVVLLHHGKGMVKEMIYGSITSFATRHCKRPLVVYYGEQDASR